jgi:hypothetical protein
VALLATATTADTSASVVAPTMPVGTDRYTHPEPPWQIEGASLASITPATNNQFTLGLPTTRSVQPRGRAPL